MVAAQNYSSQQYAQPNPQRVRRVSEEQRRRRVAEKAARLEEQHRREQAKHRAMERQKQLSRQRMLRKLSVVGFVMLCFAMLAVTVAGYSMVASAKVAYNAGQAELKELQAQIVDLEIDASAAMDISSVEKKAASLGMGFPKYYQTVAISSGSGAAAGLNNGTADFGVSDIYASLGGQQ